jgi:saccharopine dehydrogenase-like NADP-dependent oxidoreductase
MKKILILGAGQSAPYLIHFMLEHAKENNWFVKVCDYNLELAEERVNNHPNGQAVKFDVNDSELRQSLIKESDIVINLLAPTFQYQVALDCVMLGKHVITASYTDPRVAELNDDAIKKNILVLNEMGLDPGIDHMSAMDVIEKVKKSGGEITGFLSYGSAVAAPSPNLNPLGYYITWNPRNVVMAGEAGALYMENGKKKVLSQQNVFRRTWEVEVEGVGTLEAYPNRDSLIYTNVFHLPHVKTMIRGTLRYPGWSEVWRQIILLGMPNERMLIPGLSEMTYAEFTEMFVALNASGNSIKNRVASSLSINPTGSIMKKLEWLGLFSDEKIGGNPKTAADVLVELLKKKLKMPEGEKDMVVLMHQIDATFDDGKQKRYSSLMVEYGDPKGFTAIAKTVGLPAALAATMLLKDELQLRGCHIPTHPAIYSKVLGKLADYGIKFQEVVEEK